MYEAPFSCVHEPMKLLALAVVLVPFAADAATPRTRPSTHVPPTRTAAVSPVRSTALTHSPTAHARRRHPAHRQIVAPGLIHVHDGDTFYVGATAYRLKGIDTPELGQPRAEAARQRLLSLLRAGPVTIVRRAEDVYGRIVADVYVGTRNISRTLRQEGYAKPHAPRRP